MTLPTHGLDSAFFARIRCIMRWGATRLLCTNLLVRGYVVRILSSLRCVRPLRAEHQYFLACTFLALLSIFQFCHIALADDSPFPAASQAPHYSASRSADLDATAPADEPQSGKTERGTPVNRRIEACFPAETRNVFDLMDAVPDANGNPQPFDYLDAGYVSPEARDAIRGRNTWVLWGEGNEVFWNWVQERGYGLADFLILIDSRQRGTRFKDSGLINQPGMKARTDQKILGLYIDQADADKISLSKNQPANDVNAGETAPVKRAVPPSDPKHPSEAFTPGDPKLYQEILAKLADDGADPNVYGYPTGIVGLRLFPNPDFFGTTADAAAARKYWNERVEQAKDDAYYSDTTINADPNLIRPFRVSMSCGFCHVGPHPLFPPADPEKPDWVNLSNVIGDQYWTPVKTFSNLKKSDSFLYQFLASQQPGTIDTSLVSTDHINNPNTITAVFDVPARLERALLNSPEKQSAASLKVPEVEDPQPGTNPRHTPRVLLDGADSIGVFGALSRVYLNIGTYSEQWKRLHNTVVGFREQSPFSVEAAQKKSVYWRTAEKYRIPYLASYFTYKSKSTGESIAAPMHLADIPASKAKLAGDAALVPQGRQVFIENCAVCHSSKQPSGFTLSFSREWAKQSDKPAGNGALQLPLDYADWDGFLMTPAYLDYVKRIGAIAGTAPTSGPDPFLTAPTSGPDPFLKDNFLSTDVRVPITLVGTNSGRAVATNGMRGQIWDNFSSEDYKSLPAVGDVHFYNPYSGTPVDAWGNNDSYRPPGGGPGYYRPASLISLWATAPYLHNNALGKYTHNPSIDGRLEAFEDGIDKILWKERRVASADHRPGDLRWDAKALTAGDPGFIYRTTEKSWIDFPAPFIRQLISGVVGDFLTSVLATYLWIGLVVVSLLLAVFGRARHAGFAIALIAVIVAALLRVSRVDTVYPLLWLIPAIGAALALVIWLVPQKRWIAVVTFTVLALVWVGAGVKVHAFINGEGGDLKVGPVPKGTPVNLIMNIDPEAPLGDLLDAVFGMTRGFLRVGRAGDDERAALDAFQAEAGLALMKASKCPDFVLDRGHWFAQHLSDEQKRQLKAFLKTL
jgi:hypothetical protein